MESNCKSILWFRWDLRIEDNPALAAACWDGSVLQDFIWCPKEEGQYLPGRVSRWWLKQSLIHLEQSLKSLGTELVLIKAQCSLSALLDCVSAVGATKVVFNHLYDPVSLVRDHNIKQKLSDMGVGVQSYNGELLHEPWSAGVILYIMVPPFYGESAKDIFQAVMREIPEEHFRVGFVRS